MPAFQSSSGPLNHLNRNHHHEQFESNKHPTGQRPVFQHLGQNEHHGIEQKSDFSVHSKLHQSSLATEPVVNNHLQHSLGQPELASSKLYANSNNIQLVGTTPTAPVTRHHSFQLATGEHTSNSAGSSILAHNNQQLGSAGGFLIESGQAKVGSGTTVNYMSTNAGKRRPSAQTVNKPSPNYGLSNFGSNPELCSKEDSGGSAFGRMSIQPVAELQQVVGSVTTATNNQSETISLAQNGSSGAQILCKVCGDKAR